MILGFGNNVSSAIASNITASQTVIPVLIGTGALFADALTYSSIIPPVISGSVPIFAKVTLTDSQETTFEICHLISVSGDNLTVIRGQEGTTAKSWSLNDTIANFATKGSENRFIQIEEAQRGFYQSATATGTGNALVVALPSTLGENAVAAATANFNSPILIIPSAANTGNVTISASAGLLSFTVNAPLLKGVGIQMAPGDLQAGAPFLALWSESAKCWYHCSATGNNAYATIANIQSDGYLYALDTGTANTYTVAYSPTIAAITDGMTLKFKAKTANTGASTFSPNGLGAKPIVGGAHAALQGGEIAPNGDVWLQYNSSIGAGSWVLVDSTGGALQVAQASKSQQAIQFGQASGVIGQCRNMKMSIASASASATLMADEIILETTLGGLRYCLSNFNKAINISIVGVGGMDIGAAPANGYVAIYAIYNPVTGDSALLGWNAASTVAPEIYAGSNMPSGYTASALVSVWPINGSSQLITGFQCDRRISYAGNKVLNSSTVNASYTSLSISGAVPLNAKGIRFELTAFSTVANTVQTLVVASDGSGTGFQAIAGGTIVASNGIGCNGIIDLKTPSTIFWLSTNSGGVPTYTIVISAYYF